MTAAGELALWAALLIAAWGSVAGSTLLAAPGRAGATGFAESSRRALWAAALLLAVAVAGVAAMLLAPDPSFAFAASSVTTRMPAVDRLAALVTRWRGELLVLATLTAVFGAFALRNARGVPSGRGSSLATPNAMLSAVVLLFAALPLIVGANPYARAAAAPGAGTMIVPSWEQPYHPLARLGVLIVIAMAIVAAALGASGHAARQWWIAAWGLGAVAHAVSLRAALTGRAWGWFEWVAFVSWLALAVWLHRDSSRPPLAKRLALAGALVAVSAFAGSFMRTQHRITLEAAQSAELNDAFRSQWRFTSEGLSVFDELDRQAAVVLVSVRHGVRTRLGRVELRQYIDDDGAPVGREVPVSAYFPGPLVSAVVAFAQPPGTGSVTLLVRFVPLFTWWWAAAALFAASAAAMLREERAT